jgi:SAM-dependent methyltransferase
MTNGVSTTPEPDMGAAYGQAAESWSRGAAIVYGPLADALLDLVVPDHWTGRAVLDLGAGTGVVSDRLRDRGARPVALDLSEDMLRLDRHRRPPALVADVGALPLATAALDGVVASFVLNHVGDPIGVLREMARVSRPGSLVATSVFSSRSSHEPRDRVDRVATRWGWTAPDWYAEVTTATAPLLASAGARPAALIEPSLAPVVVDEGDVDVGVTTATQLVAYRLGQAHIAAFLAGLGPHRHARLEAEAVAAVGDPMEPYRPTVVFSTARVA